jgi:hypothetical protein
MGLRGARPTLDPYRDPGLEDEGAGRDHEIDLAAPGSPKPNVKLCGPRSLGRAEDHGGRGREERLLDLQDGLCTSAIVGRPST